jgi:hypothetical protein
MFALDKGVPKHSSLSTKARLADLPQDEFSE